MTTQLQGQPTATERLKGWNGTSERRWTEEERRAQYHRRKRMESKAKQALEVWAAWRKARNRNADDPTWADVFGSRYKPLYWYANSRGQVRQFVPDEEPKGWIKIDEYEPHRGRVVSPGSSVALMALAVDRLINGTGPDRYRALLKPNEVALLLAYYPTGGVYDSLRLKDEEKGDESLHRHTREPSFRAYFTLIRKMTYRDERERIGTVPGRVLDAMPTSEEEGK